MSASTISFSSSAKTPSAQAALTSDFTIAMFCSCIVRSRGAQPATGPGRGEALLALHLAHRRAHRGTQRPLPRVCPDTVRSSSLAFALAFAACVRPTDPPAPSPSPSPSLSPSPASPSMEAPATVSEAVPVDAGAPYDLVIAGG